MELLAREYRHDRLELQESSFFLVPSSCNSCNMVKMYSVGKEPSQKFAEAK